jgi:hypothetical protein
MMHKKAALQGFIRFSKPIDVYYVICSSAIGGKSKIAQQLKKLSQVTNLNLQPPSLGSSILQRPSNSWGWGMLNRCVPGLHP